jgi:hypothetical protein
MHRGAIMHFEVPKAKSFKAFAGEYVMIVVSILTALALEHGAQRLHHSHVAHEAAANLDLEINANIAEIRSVIKHNSEQIAILDAMKTVLLAEIKAGATDRDAIRHTMERTASQFRLSIQSPTLQREAWDVAVANQAVSYMPASLLQRYARLYAAMRDTQTILVNGTGSFMSLPQFRDTFSDLEMQDGNARSLYRMLGQINASYGSSVGNLKALEKQLVEGARQIETGKHD